jgi:hypothetical protein
MAWKQAYRDMAFCPYRDDLAAARALHDALMTLRQHLDGQCRTYEILDALRHLEYACGQPIRRSMAEFRRCLFWEDESTRHDVARRCLIEIAGWIDRSKSGRLK